MTDATYNPLRLALVDLVTALPWIFDVEDDYEALLEHIDDADVEVITFDDLWEMRTAQHY